jgi:hypothetical protein
LEFCHLKDVMNEIKMISDLQTTDPLFGMIFKFFFEAGAKKIF